jgi:hypothetical protein
MDEHCDHRLRVDDRHHKDFLCVDDLMTDVSRANRNCVRRDLMMDENLDVNRDHRRNDLLDDHLMDDDHRDVLVDHHMNGMGDQNDLMTDVSRVIRNCVRCDLKTDENPVNRNYVLHDRKMDENLDVSRGLHMSDLLDDHSMDDDHHGALVGHRKNGMDDRNDLKMDGNLDVNRGLRMNVTGDLNLGGNHVNRSCAPHDRNLDVTIFVKNLPVMLMVYLSKSCDRKSHDHLRCGHRMMRHRDTNRMDGKNLDGNHPKKDDPIHLRRVNRRMKVYPKMDDRKMI